MGTSKKQIHANRRNAKRSTGPRNTTKTRFNALRHGILAQKAFISNGLGHEDEKVFNELLEGFYASLEPEGALVSWSVEKLVELAWRLGRVPAFETAVLSDQAHAVLQNHALKPPSSSDRYYKGDPGYSEMSFDHLMVWATDLTKCDTYLAHKDPL